MSVLVLGENYVNLTTKSTICHIYKYELSKNIPIFLVQFLFQLLVCLIHSLYNMAGWMLCRWSILCELESDACGTVLYFTS